MATQTNKSFGAKLRSSLQFHTKRSHCCVSIYPIRPRLRRVECRRSKQAARCDCTVAATTASALPGYERRGWVRVVRVHTWPIFPLPALYRLDN